MTTFEKFLFIGTLRRMGDSFSFWHNHLQRLVELAIDQLRFSCQFHFQSQLRASMRQTIHLMGLELHLFVLLVLLPEQIEAQIFFFSLPQKYSLPQPDLIPLVRPAEYFHS